MKYIVLATEKLLVAICTIAAAILWLLFIADKAIRVAAELIAISVIFLGVVFIIANLEQTYQGMVLNILMIGSAISFICFVVLYFWRREKFKKIFKNFLNKNLE